MLSVQRTAEQPNIEQFHMEQIFQTNIVKGVSSQNSFHK